MKVKITDGMGNDQEKELDIKQMKVNDLLVRLKINPFEAIIMRKGEIIVESDVLTNGDEIKIVNVIHGG